MSEWMNRRSSEERNGGSSGRTCKRRRSSDGTASVWTTKVDMGRCSRSAQEAEPIGWCINPPKVQAVIAVDFKREKQPKINKDTPASEIMFVDRAIAVSQSQARMRIHFYCCLLSLRGLNWKVQQSTSLSWLCFDGINRPRVKAANAVDSNKDRQSKEKAIKSKEHSLSGASM